MPCLMFSNFTFCYLFPYSTKKEKKHAKYQKQIAKNKGKLFFYFLVSYEENKEFLVCQFLKLWPNA